MPGFTDEQKKNRNNIMNKVSVLICTFSQTGTTDKVARKIGEGLNLSGIEVSFHAILDKRQPDYGNFDVIGIGYPVYAFRAPFPVNDFVRSMPDMAKKFFFTFVQYGTDPGDAGNSIRKLLRQKHAIDAGYLLTRGADYFIGYLRKGYMFSAGFPGEGELQTAVEFGMSIAHRVHHGFPAPEPYDPPTKLLYAFERFSLNRFSTKLYLARSFKAGKECDGCGICIKKCPLDNITAGKDKRPVWGRNCMLCATCELKCPKDAIRSPYDWAMNTPFFELNIKKALKAHMPVTRVKFEKSRIQYNPN
jgi:ferredoxin/flavodoxin